jgi:hypothetical protein
MSKKQDKKPTKKHQVVVRLGTQEEANRLNAGGATQIVLNRGGNRFGLPPKETKTKE